MGWTKLFKPKGAKAKPDPRIRWFGKLPTYADYYTSPAEEDWAVEFNEWVLRGFEIYRSRLVDAGAARRRLPISGCVFRLPKSEMTVLASIQDYGGDLRGRPFPICFYVAVPTAGWPGPTSGTLGPAVSVLEDLTALKREVPRFLNSPGRFEAVFGDRKVELNGLDAPTDNDSWTRQAQAVTLADWFTGARGGLKVDEADHWCQLVNRWGENVATLESETFEPTFRVPLAAGVSGPVQWAGWLRWLESRMELGRRALSLVVSAELQAGPGYLNIVARELVPEDFLLMTALAHTLPYLDDLSQVQGEAGPRADPATAGSSWLDFVNSQAAGAS